MNVLFHLQNCVYFGVSCAVPSSKKRKKKKKIQIVVPKKKGGKRIWIQFDNAFFPQYPEK